MRVLQHSVLQRSPRSYLRALRKVRPRARASLPYVALTDHHPTPTRSWFTYGISVSVVFPPPVSGIRASEPHADRGDAVFAGHLLVPHDAAL